MLIFLIIWIGFSILAGVVASNKGRSGVGFFFLAFLLSPLVGLLGAILCKANTEATEKKAVQDGTMRRCPFCAEIIRAEAKICRYCRSELEPVVSRLEGFAHYCNIHSRGFDGEECPSCKQERLNKTIFGKKAKVS
jgi:RNA polymerase subunit RPABC4/transcription elongation factor Spt4